MFLKKQVSEKIRLGTQLVGGRSGLELKSVDFRAHSINFPGFLLESISGLCLMQLSFCISAYALLKDMAKCAVVEERMIDRNGR